MAASVDSYISQAFNGLSTWTHDPVGDATCIVVFGDRSQQWHAVTGVTYGNKPLTLVAQAAASIHHCIWVLEDISGRDDNVVRVTATSNNYAFASMLIAGSSGLDHVAGGAYGVNPTMFGINGSGLAVIAGNGSSVSELVTSPERTVHISSAYTSSYFRKHESGRVDNSGTVSMSGTASPAAQVLLFADAGASLPSRPRVTGLVYGGESGYNGSYGHHPSRSQVGLIVCYNREEQYSDFENAAYGGLAMTRQQLQSGGGNIRASALWSLVDLAGKASNSVSWTSSYTNNHKWSCNIDHSMPVSVVASAKSTLSGAGLLTMTLDPGELDCAAILLLQSNSPGVHTPQTVNGESMLALGTGSAAGKQFGVFTVPVLAGAGPTVLSVQSSVAYNSMLGMLVGAAPIAASRKRNQAIVVV